MIRKSLITSLYTQVVERRFARFHPWILAGLVIQYIVTFPFLGNPLWVTVLVAVAGWFYYRKVGFWAGILAFFLDLFLINLYEYKITWGTLTQITNGILVGHIFVMFIGTTFGYLRAELEKFYKNNQRLSSQERTLILVNMIVREILERKDLNERYYRILIQLTNLFVADYAYLVYSNESEYQAVVLASTTTSERSHLTTVFNLADAALVMSAMESNQMLFIEDAQASQLIVDSPIFQEHRSSIQSVLVIPLVARGYRFGAVILGFDTRRRIDPDELAHFELTGVQITLALRTVLQEQRIEKQLKEAKVLASIERALSESEKIGLDAVLQLIVSSARDLIPNTTHAVLHLLDHDQRVLIPRAVSGIVEGRKSNLHMHLGEGVAGQVLYDGEAVAVSDIRTDARFINQTVPVAFRSIAVAPVLLKQKRIGTISVLSSEVGKFQPDDVNLLVSLGTLSAIAIENSQLLEDIKEALAETSSLYEISRELVTLDVNELLDKTVELLKKNFQYYHVQVYLVEPATGELVLRSASGDIGRTLIRLGGRLSSRQGVVRHVYETVNSLFTNDVDNIPFFVREPLLPETKSELTVVIKSGSIHFGVLDVQQTSQHPLMPRDLQLVNAVAEQLAIALQRAALYENLQKALQQEQTMRSQLMQSERLAMVGRLLASISHELNNPLQAIQNVLFLLKKDEQLSAQGREDLEVILSETERMTSLIGRLRTTYRTPPAQEFLDVRLNSMIEDVYALTATYMRHKNIVFEFIPDGTDVIVPGMPDQIRQVLLNLFMNAIDAMPTGGKITVHTQNLLAEKKIYLTVLDTGAGIAPDILPNIFEPFTTDKETGTGLGMTIARDIILQHSGEIQAQNNPDGGAMIKIWLPTTKKGMNVL